jgi:hypothetical protein
MRAGAIALPFVLGAVAGAPASAAAQDGASVDPVRGARVRVTSPATGRLVGTLVRQTADSVRVELPGGSSLAFPSRAITELELSAGVRRQGWRGAGIGALAGAGIGGAIGLATYRRTRCDDPILDAIVCSLVDQTSRSVTVISDATMGAAAGAIVGALIGNVPRERWVRVPLDRAVRVGVAPMPDRAVGVVVHATF